MALIVRSSIDIYDYRELFSLYSKWSERKILDLDDQFETVRLFNKLKSNMEYICDPKTFKFFLQMNYFIEVIKNEARITRAVRNFFVVSGKTQKQLYDDPKDGVVYELGNSSGLLIMFPIMGKFRSVSINLNEKVNGRLCDMLSYEKFDCQLQNGSECDLFWSFRSTFSFFDAAAKYDKKQSPIVDYFDKNAAELTETRNYDFIRVLKHPKDLLEMGFKLNDARKYFMVLFFHKIALKAEEVK
ncbi:MAG: hypothetical protein A3F40_01480 [Chlamydiae bacterium RIFCSPHIGHO2_12_FULL_27_8]|nr:MAG: hypothetical protein A3F40_01480 [Chlamydiae bacterium RIFCSPHIGHO2_12_FULL_27_8]